MPSTKDTLMGVGVAAAVAMGAASLARGPDAVKADAGAPMAAAPMQPQAPPPNPCRERCDSLPETCLHVVNCVEALTSRKVDCSQPLSQSLIDELGWCPVEAGKPLFGGGR